MKQFIDGILSILSRYGSSLLLGVRTTLIVSLTGTILGLILGLAVGGLRAAKLDYTASPASRFFKKLFDIFANIYITVFRGTPMMVAAIFVISINTGAYMAEIVRSGIQAVDIGQTEAARSLGLSNTQTMMQVVLPQAIRNAFPAIGNEFIVNIKDSSVLMIISITELMFQSKSIYLLLTTIASLILNYIERRMNRPKMSLPQSVTDPKNVDYIGEVVQKGGNSDYAAR